MKKIEEVAKKAAFAAAKIMLKNFNNIKISFKAAHEIVTQSDVECEKEIIKIINKTFPKHQILSEETCTKTDIDSDNLWIIDPIDGTHNYAKLIPHFSVSIAYAEKGKVLFGLVYDPSRKELFTAIKSKGAYLNGKQIFVSETKTIQKSVISTGFYYNRGELMLKTLDSIRILLQSGVSGIRRIGSAALDLCWVANGRFDGYFEYMLSPWDFAAGFLIVNEAGGVCLNRFGKIMQLSGTGIIASNKKINKVLVAKVKY